MRILLKSALLATCMFIAFAANAYDFMSDGIYYNINSSNGTVTVTNSGTNIQYTGDVTIPATVAHEGKTYNVTAIASYAFLDNVELSSITIGNKVRSIGFKAFSGCTMLTTVVIPNSTEILDEQAFVGCSNLKNLTIGSSVKAIGNSAFQECTSLAKVVIPGSAETIGSSAFSGCNHLTDLTIESGVVTIGIGAFQGCSTLPSVTLPNTVKTINSYAFQNCVELNEIDLSNQLKTIGYQAFKGCNALKTITSRNEIAPTMENENCFSLYEGVKLYIPIGSRDSYMSTNYWNKFTEVIEKKMDYNGPVTGDVNGDGEVNIADINFIIDIIIRGHH